MGYNFHAGESIEKQYGHKVDAACSEGFEHLDGVCWHRAGVPLPGEPRRKAYTVTSIDKSRGTVTLGRSGDDQIGDNQFRPGRTRAAAPAPAHPATLKASKRRKMRRR